MTTHATLRFTISASTIALAAGSLHAQCPEPSWLPGHGHAGADLTPTCSTMWDHDKNPATPRWLVVGGSFWYVGTVQGDGVAAWDPATGQWHQLGEGPQIEPGQYPECLGVLADGTLVAGGWLPGGVVAWNGSTWVPLDGSMDGIVFGFANMPNGDLIAAGGFTVAGLPAATNLARWNGTQWTEVAPGIENGIDWSQGQASDVAVLPNGNMVVTGAQQITPGTFQHITRWDGTQWHAMGAPPDFEINDLDVASNGDLLVSGGFTQIDGVPASRVARWNGQGWHALGNGINPGLPTGSAGIHSVKAMPDGSIFAGGDIFDTSGSLVGLLARWNGTDWDLLDTQSNTYIGVTVRFIERLDDNSIALNCDGPYVGGEPTGNIARFTGTAWKALSNGFNSYIDTFEPMPDGRMIFGGAFSTTPNVQANLIAIWDGTDWTSLPGLNPGLGTSCLTASVLSDGTIFAGGAGVFTNSAAALHEGGAWTDLQVVYSDPTNMAEVYDSVRVSNGDLVFGGGFELVSGLPANNVARLLPDRTPSTLGGGIDGLVTAMVELPGGDLLASGLFTSVENGSVSAMNLATWNGLSWAEFAGGADSYVAEFHRLPNGTILAVGSFSTIGGVAADGIALWDGSQWSRVGDLELGEVDEYSVQSIAVAENGDIYIGGWFEFVAQGGQIARGIGRYDGTSWHALGDGVQNPPGNPSGNGVVYALAFGLDDQLLVGGTFFKAGGQVSAYFARYGCEAPACYADCDGGGSLNIDDFICFQTLFAIGSNAADCDASGSLDIDDFICFQTFFALGC